jgi:type IV pilus assembly protein PilY1
VHKVLNLELWSSCKKYSDLNSPVYEEDIEIMKTNLMRSMVLKYLVCLPLVLAGQAQALQPLSNSPLFLGGNISPNVMFTLDDSGSMHFEIMPGELIKSSVRYMFPRASGIYGGSDYNNYVVNFNPNNKYTASLRSNHVNKIYYNPAVTYQPWSNADGSLMSNASFTCAPHNPMNIAAGCRNLTVNNTNNLIGNSREDARWLKSDGTLSSARSKTFYPAVYFNYNGGNINSASSYTQVEIRSGSTYVGGANRTDCAVAPTCTYNEEIQNFANWYTYYRSRVLLARAGIGRAFSAQGNTMRVGFAAINQGSSTIDGVSTGTVINGVRQFTGANKTNFFTNLYGHTIPAAGTPLRRAVDHVGKYFMRDDDEGPWGETPGSSGGTQQVCRQNYNILMTDGYWSSGNPPAGIGNSDNTAGATISNDSSPATPPTYTYTPTLPYSDSNSGTLADVAMRYWKTDLRTDLDNKVPSNPADPAFWQHMVNFTVGLGVSGTLADLPSGGQAWPDPTSGNSAKIDDLWHAAVNSRGSFFSAADPATFADALTNALTTIISRTGSASAVAANSNSLITNGRIYQAKFNSGDWSGQLLSIPIDSNAVLGATEWNAGAVSLAPGTIAPSSRIMITKGSSDGVPFQYANLSAAHKALLDKNASGTVDNCGPERIAYLRGDAVHEGAGGTFACASASVINKLRTRASTKLGDIVNSGPFYVGSPNAGHSDVDHTGYAAFRTSYKDRAPVVYVGANDGILHGFNACIAGVTPGCTAADAGKELIAYIPSIVYANLSRPSDKDYNDNHRYFVDGSPMVADAYTGTTPTWKSVLVGSLNGGGQGYYALDVTNPTDGSQSAPVFSAANAADLLLWEFTDADDVDMGYSYNLPPINPFTGQASQIAKMENNQWAVIVGNGYNSAGGKAVLYILFITGGEDGVWTLGTDYIKLVADAGTGNGLSTPMPFDADGDGKVDVIYAGDIKGNLWKFDVSSSSPASWGMAIGGLPLFVSGTSKPIISPPAVTFHPDGGQQILFGTGKYLETGDTTNTDTQIVYGIRDHNAIASIAIGELVEQVLTDTTVRTATQHLVPYSPTKKGWYLNLPISGERLTGVSRVEDGLFTFSTIIPSASPCDFGGRGFVNTVDFLTGGMLPFPAFDINRNRQIGLDDGLSAGVEIGFAVGGVTRIRGHQDDVLISSTADGSLVQTPATKGAAGLRGRITWRELIQ